jgi:hypothetical protein
MSKGAKLMEIYVKDENYNSSSTIFGCDNFMEKYITEINKTRDNYIIEKTKNRIKFLMPEIKIDDKKLCRWVNMCVQLDNIDKQSLDDIAIKKKICDLNCKITELKQALDQARKEDRERVCDEIKKKSRSSKFYGILVRQCVDEIVDQIKGETK